MDASPARARRLFKARFGMLLVLLCTLGLAHAAGPVDCGNRPIKLAYFEYGIIYSDGAGIDRDVMEELSKRSGCHFIFSFEPRARIWAEIENGNLDMGTYGLQNAERDKFAWFAIYITTKFYAVVRKDLARTVKRAEDFTAQPGLKLGAVRSYSHGVEQDNLISQLRELGRIDDCVDAKALFKKFQAQRFDATFAEPLTFRKYLHDFGMEADVVIEDWAPNTGTVAHGLVMSKHHFTEEQAAQWRRLIETMRSDGTLERIYRRYLPASDVAQMLKLTSASKPVP